MTLALKEIRKLHDKAYSHNQVTRERAADDMLFAVVTQWDDNMLGESTLQYRGEFNIIKKAIRQTLADLHSNEVQIDFQPEGETSDDTADFMDGLYRTSVRANTAKESFDNATQEQVICGLGGWRLYTEYKNNSKNGNEQVIKREPIYEFNNNAFPDPNAKRLDKSDAMYWSVLISYSEDGYKKLVKDLTGEELAQSVDASFAFPQQTYVFPWIAQDKQIYVVRFYHKELVKKKLVMFEDMFGEIRTYDSKEIKEVEDELIDLGFKLAGDKTIEAYEVTEYIVGHEILDTNLIAGENIPVVPDYGERVFVEGEEVYEGVTRAAKDPQRLRNFQMSYLADIVSRSPRVKPIYTPEQIQGFEDMYTENGADNNYPYMLMNSKDAQGAPLPTGAVATTPEQTIPQSLILSIDLSRQAVEDVANPGVPQDIADTDLSGKAVMAMQNRLDNQSFVYQDHHKYAIRYDAEVFTGMAKVIHDTPQKVTTTSIDGSRQTVDVMQEVIDQETGELVKLNDLTEAEFNIYSDIGKPYDSVKQQNKEEILEMVGLLDVQDPMRQAYILQYNTMLDGAAFKDIREYANKQLILTGFKEPETPEEEEMLMQARQQQEQQSQQPDASMVMAQAEMLKGQADLLEQQNRQQEMSISAGKIQAEAMSRSDKLQSETQLNIAKIQQNQQKIDNDAMNNATKNAISITEMEMTAQRDLNNEIRQNYGGLMQRVN
jgi:hypothetical protein